MDISTSVLSSTRNQTDPVRSIALPSPKSPSDKFLFEKRRSVLSTCTADWAAHSSRLLGDIFSLSLSVCHGEVEKSCRWRNQGVGIMSLRTECLLGSPFYSLCLCSSLPFPSLMQQVCYLQLLSWPFCLYPICKLKQTHRQCVSTHHSKNTSRLIGSAA